MSFIDYSHFSVTVKNLVVFRGTKSIRRNYIIILHIGDKFEIHFDNEIRIPFDHPETRSSK
jgi:hypothetical protein